MWSRYILLTLVGSALFWGLLAMVGVIG